jgi:hypoxanthine-DNA glycosylase
MPRAKTQPHRRLGDAVQCFPPIVGRGARVLVLGSMPGAASLAAGQYYAHRDNAFWPIMAALCSPGSNRAGREDAASRVAAPGASQAATYALRTRALRHRGIAVWDVLRRCVRPGSLDADIEAASIEVNDFAAFFARHRGIRAVFCNGSTAFALFRRRAMTQLRDQAVDLPVVRLPSTSPAHASLSRAQKLSRWIAAIAPLLAAGR